MIFLWITFIQFVYSGFYININHLVQYAADDDDDGGDSYFSG